MRGLGCPGNCCPAWVYPLASGGVSGVLEATGLPGHLDRRTLKSIYRERKAQNHSECGHISGTQFHRRAPTGQRTGGEGAGRVGQEGGPLLCGESVLAFEFVVMQEGSKSDVCFKKINLV